MKQFWLLALTMLFLAGCATNKEDDAISKSDSAEEIYNTAKQLVQEKNFRSGIEHYEALEARFPFSEYATLAQLDLMEAYLEISEPTSTVAAAERFIRLNPQHEKADKAFYLKALALYKGNWSMVQRIMPIDMAKRDQANAREAFQAFAALVQKYPNSEYVEDARKRMIYLRNQLANHELDIAKYYMTKKAYIAASKRARYIVEHYPRTPAVKDALEIQVEAYTELDLHDLADSARNLLEINSDAEG